MIWAWNQILAWIVFFRSEEQNKEKLFFQNFKMLNGLKNCVEKVLFILSIR